ncbi:MAG: YraN family protein [Acidimicrobiia bacterium]|nr:YraN family protein [Acidimicrobiia bacterium]
MGHVPPGPVSLDREGPHFPRREHRRSRSAGDPDSLRGRPSLGRLGEHLACRFLESHGLIIIRRNLLVPWGEVDAIGVDRGIAVMIEVRTSSCARYPLDAIDRRKEDQLAALARRLGIWRVDLVGVGVHPAHVVFHWAPDMV